MTTPVTLFRAHLNLGPDDVADDALLTHKLAAAEAWIASYTGSAFPSSNVPAPLTEVVLQLATHWFEQREAVTFGPSGASIPFGVAELLSPYRESVTGYVPH